MKTIAKPETALTSQKWIYSEQKQRAEWAPGMCGLSTRQGNLTWSRSGVLTIYKSHPGGNFRHKHKTIKCKVAEEEITIKYIHIS